MPTKRPTFTHEKPHMQARMIAITSPAMGSVTPMSVPTHAKIRRARLNRWPGGGADSGGDWRGVSERLDDDRVCKR